MIYVAKHIQKQDLDIKISMHDNQAANKEQVTERL